MKSKRISHERMYEVIRSPAVTEKSMLISLSTIKLYLMLLLTVTSVKLKKQLKLYLKLK